MMQDLSIKESDSLNENETWRILKNVVVISLAFMVQFTAYNGAANLQSSINAQAGLGTASLAAVYAGLVFSSLFLPVVIINWLGTKWTICLSFLTYMPYIAAQLKPTFYTMIPAGLIVGLGAGPLWCAKCTYMSVVSEVQSKISNISAEALLTRFLGLFFMIFMLTLGDNAAAVTSVNASQIPELCGANFLPAADAGKALPSQPPERIQLIAGLYLACMSAAALIVAFGVDSTDRYESGCISEASRSWLTLMAVTLKLLIEPNQLLLGIISAFIGYQGAFFSAVVTSAFVACALGTGFVGFVMMTYGVAAAIGCVVTGYLAKVTGRLPLICAATAVHAALFVTILTWRPQAGFSYVLYIIAVLWGLCDAIWIVLINAYFGVLFPGREAGAFAICHLWQSVGHIIAYLISPYLRTSSKTYLMIAMMAAGVMGYFTVEVRDRSSKRTLKIMKEVTLRKFPGKSCDNEGFQKDL